MLQRPKDVAAQLGVTTQTLRTWHRQGLLHAQVAPSGHKRYMLPSEHPCNNDNGCDDHEQSTCILYARVSSRKQRGDLERQIATLQTHRQGARIISDIASGINFQRQGLLSVLDIAFGGGLKELVVTHRDRLARFGFDLLQYILQRHGATITVLNPPGASNSPDELGTSELADDLMAIVTVFAARHHGRRSHHRRLPSPMPETSDLPDSRPETPDEQDGRRQ